MPQAGNEQKTRRRPHKQQRNLAPLSEPKCDSHVTESRNALCKNPNKNKNKNKKKFLFVKLRGLGCKGTSLPASTPAIIRSAADWEAKRSKKQNQNKRKKQLHNRRNQGNVVIDVPDVCCAPLGIGIVSDFAPRTRNSAPRIDHKKHSRDARRNEDDSVPEFPAIISGGVGSRINQRAAGEIIEMMMFRQTLLSGGLGQDQDQDQYQEWRLNVDHMSYEELLDLGDQIGYVGTGLQEEEILSCLRKPKHSRPLMTNQREWICSICQEKYRRDYEIGTLDCGHHHHLHCIKQWLLYKNACPVCKSAAMHQRIE